MKSFFRSVAISMVLPALAAGFCFCSCGALRRLPRGVFVNGRDVGGMSPSAAVELVRRDTAADLAGRRLNVCSDEHVYVYCYPEISFKDDAVRVVYGIRRAGEYTVTAKWLLNGLDSVVAGICAAEYREFREPAAHFNAGEGEAFYYDEGQTGVRPDGEGLRRDILASLAARSQGEDFAPVRLGAERRHFTGNIRALKGRTARLSAYTTYFDGQNMPRVSNIKLACAKISGCVLPPGGTFSFNGRVGARTAENGFRRAKIIEGGRFVYGLGGGVCQVSTTLYNAALLAGLEVTEFHPHSLAVGYAEPSRDAMVSGTYSDLRFKNVTGSPVYIRVLTGACYVRCELYGLPDGVKYSLESKVTGGEDGAVESECYLVSERGGERSVRLLRRDRYLPAKDASGAS